LSRPKKTVVSNIFDCRVMFPNFSPAHERRNGTLYLFLHLPKIFDARHRLGITCLSPNASRIRRTMRKPRRNEISEERHVRVLVSRCVLSPVNDCAAMFPAMASTWNAQGRFLWRKRGLLRQSPRETFPRNGGESSSSLFPTSRTRIKSCSICLLRM